MLEDMKPRMVRNLSIASKWWDHNNQKENNSLAETMSFLKKAGKSAEECGFTNIRVKPKYEEGDANNLESCYILVVGDRLETAGEFKERLQQEIRQRRRRISESDDAVRVRDNCYQTWGDEIKKIEDIIKEYGDENV
jgi:hypothetical protein